MFFTSERLLITSIFTFFSFSPTEFEIVCVVSISSQYLYSDAKESMHSELVDFLKTKDGIFPGNIIILYLLLAYSITFITNMIMSLFSSFFNTHVALMCSRESNKISTNSEQWQSEDKASTSNEYTLSFAFENILMLCGVLKLLLNGDQWPRQMWLSFFNNVILFSV